MARRLAVVSAALAVVTVSCLAKPAPGGPGFPSTWAPAAKEFLGTSATATSRVYFTGAEGIVTEVFYPSPDRIQNVDLQFIVLDAHNPAGAGDAEERRQARHDISQVNKRAMLWQASTTANNNDWKLSKLIFTDPGRDALIVRTTFEVLAPGKSTRDFDVFVLNNPAINNTGDNDTSRTLQSGGRTLLVASDPIDATTSALAVSLPWKALSNGFVGRSDGWTDLFGGADDRKLDWQFESATGGNVAQIGWLDLGSGTARSVSFDVVLAFGPNENAAIATAAGALSSNLDQTALAYTQQWAGYAQTLDNQGGTADDQYYLAAMTLKCSQDKANGAMVAGLTVPWGTACGDGNQGGYHLVWARDLFKFASALIAAGDRTSANLAVDFLFTTQMEPSGRFPQNTYVNGQVYWSGTQMDESAMPIILAWKLGRTDLWPQVKKAADFITANGPATSQERWEEMAGYSPSTIAAEIAGLVCAADLAAATHNPDDARRYLTTADAWRNNVANWTFTNSGFHRDAALGQNGTYYIRINANRDPNDDVQLAFQNGAGAHGERYIVDGGFLELVRMGAMSPEDWTILETLPEYDSILKQTLPGKGDAWFRYNYDGYGEHPDGRCFDGTGRGRLWPIFTAERGIYEIDRSRAGATGKPYLAALKAFSSPSGFIPEQVWNLNATVTGWPTPTPAGCTPGLATGSAQPLNWAMGEYINLVAAMYSGRGDAPAVVRQRYGTDRPQVTATFKVIATTNWGQNVYLIGDHPLLGQWRPEAAIKLSPANYPTWSTTVSLPADTAYRYKYIIVDDKGRVLWDGNPDRNVTTPATGTLALNDQFL